MQFNILLVITKSAYSYGGTDIIMLLYKPDSCNYASTAVFLAMAWYSVAQCQLVFLGTKVSCCAVCHYLILFLTRSSSSIHWLTYRTVETGRISEYKIRLKLNVCAGSPNECRIFS